MTLWHDCFLLLQARTDADEESVVDCFLLLQARTDADEESVVDRFAFRYDDVEANSVAVMTGVFVAPSDNTYVFMLHADDSGVLYARTEDAANAVSF